MIQAIRRGDIRPCVSPDILDEYADVLTRPKFRFSDLVVTDMLALFRTKGEMHLPRPLITTGPDPSDFIFMARAIAARADDLVTGNRRHFPDPFYGTAKVVNARELLSLITPL